MSINVNNVRKEKKDTEENRSSRTKKLIRIENSISPKSTSKDKNLKKRSVLRPITINKSNDEDIYLRKKISNIKILIPQPISGRQYSSLEVISILKGINEISTPKSKTITHMISKNLVPIQKSGIYKLLQRFHDGNPIKDDWCAVGRYAAGRRRLLQEDDVKIISL